MKAQQQELHQTGEVQEPDLRMGLESIDLDRNIYRQEEGGASLSGILLGTLAVPIAAFLIWMMQGMLHH